MEARECCSDPLKAIPGASGMGRKTHLFWHPELIPGYFRCRSPYLTKSGYGNTSIIIFLMTKHLPLLFPLIIQDIFDFCSSKSHQMIEGLHSCRIWHMLTVHWMVFPVHHVEFLSQVLAISSLRLRLLPLWQGDYSTKMWDYVPLLSLIIELFFSGHFQHKMYLSYVSENETKEKNRGRNIFNIYTMSLQHALVFHIWFFSILTLFLSF